VMREIDQVAIIRLLHKGFVLQSKC
jgi:hypothetical protein